ncbi:cbb3-type cytochrome c oxidase subunit II [Billgrantia lactosivorans]|uniref:cbb3-type cytochrome c oxidase subunit II n=1 Tax=Billgrantia lactosivorans TaxID=2185141 RepID=UPI000DAE3FCF|nr:cbb3-type cytochrome c oxidase subunit II [Halomonas lactosivorans]
MNRVLPLSVGAVAILASATLMLVIVPGIQIHQQQASEELEPYTEQELAGREQYISLGCVYCHTQQPRSPEQTLADAAQGWGRASVAADYVYDKPHQLGTMRTGPDLLNVGARLPSIEWHLTHLYQPRAIFDWSIMPAYPFLFELKEEAVADDVVVKLPSEYRPEGKVVVATQEALDLSAYLISLKRTYPVEGALSGMRDQGYSSTEAK